MRPQSRCPRESFRELRSSRRPHTYRSPLPLHDQALAAAVVEEIERGGPVARHRALRSVG